MTRFFTKQSHRKILLQSSVFYIVKDSLSDLLILKGFNFSLLAFQEMTQAIDQGQDFVSCLRRREIQTEKEASVLFLSLLLPFALNSHWINKNNARTRTGL